MTQISVNLKQVRWSCSWDQMSFCEFWQETLWRCSILILCFTESWRGDKRKQDSRLRNKKLNNWKRQDSVFNTSESEDFLKKKNLIKTTIKKVKEITMYPRFLDQLLWHFFSGPRAEFRLQCCQLGYQRPKCMLYLLCMGNWQKIENCNISFHVSSHF